MTVGLMNEFLLLQHHASFRKIPNSAPPVKLCSIWSSYAKKRCWNKIQAHVSTQPLYIIPYICKCLQKISIQSENIEEFIFAPLGIICKCQVINNKYAMHKTCEYDSLPRPSNACPWLVVQLFCITDLAYIICRQSQFHHTSRIHKPCQLQMNSD